MKMKPEHLAILREAIAPLDTAELRAKYIAGQFKNADKCSNRNMRYRWDLFHFGMRAAKIEIGDGRGMPGLPLYAYMTDDHIDTALRSFIPDLIVAEK